MLVLTACGPPEIPPPSDVVGVDLERTSADVPDSDSWTTNENDSDDTSLHVDPACPSTPNHIPDQLNFEWQGKSFHSFGGWPWFKESTFSLYIGGWWAWPERHYSCHCYFWPLPLPPTRPWRGVTYLGPWAFQMSLLDEVPCRNDDDCRLLSVRMSSRQFLAPTETHPINASLSRLENFRCLPIGPNESSLCAVPDEVDDARTAPSEPYACTRHSVRHHRISSCRRTHPDHPPCEGTLRCLQEGEPPYCSAPIPSAEGCIGNTPPPMPPATCTITVDDFPVDGGYFDPNLQPCPPWPATNTPCGNDHPPCAKGQLCIPLHQGRRCIDVFAETEESSAPKHGCWPHMPSSAQAGGDWFDLPGTLPDANTPTDALQAYDFRLDWQAARGVPCRNDDDCKLPVTSPFGKTVWLQGATRCAEDVPGQGGVCLKPCDIPTHGLCHQGTTCAQGPGGWRWCMPEALPDATSAEALRALACSPLAAEIAADFDAGQRPCSRTNAHGTCTGKAVCAVAGKPPICDGAEPAAETCGDGIDQDCDGATDEGCSP